MAMEDIHNNDAAVAAEKSHKCGLTCLGPLTFHSEAVGEKIDLSKSGHLAKRKGRTVKNGPVFSSRPLRVNEKICLRVEKRSCRRHGAMRVGFTNVSPSGRSLPLPPLAMPDLADRPGHWAAALPESFCGEGSELEFWVCCKGAIWVSSNSSKPLKLLSGVDLSQPLWAFIDVHRQPCSIMLLGSKKTWLFFFTRRSCPAPEQINFTDDGHNHTAVAAEKSHQCSLMCLGPLTFHSEAVGEKIDLSKSGLLAKRIGRTFKNGLVFSSRPLRVNERMCLRVEKRSCRWHGAMRVGFTNVSPSGRSLPLPPLAMPDLTDKPGHWAAVVDESLCEAGSELEFWVCSKGAIWVSSNSSMPLKLLSGVDLSQPLWAFVDVYGQTRSVMLLGSKKRWLLSFNRRSCPAPEHINSTDDGHRHSMIPDQDECLEVSAVEDRSMRCVVCMETPPRIVLPCGHRCLCSHCASRVIQQFGCCPLCRQEISITE